MIEKIESCLVTTCKSIGIDANAVFSKNLTPDKIGYDPSAQYEVLDAVHNAVNPWVERKKISESECQLIKRIGEMLVTVRLSFISVSETTLESLLIDFLRAVPKEIVWDDHTNIAVLPQQSLRRDYIERVGDPIDYKELLLKIDFKSALYQRSVEQLIKSVSVVPVSYDTTRT